MAMIVDKPGCDDLAANIDGLAGRAGQFAHLDDLAVLDRDIAVKGGNARAVDDPAVLDQDVIRHRISSSPRSRELPLFAATIARRRRPAAPMYAGPPCRSRGYALCPSGRRGSGPAHRRRKSGWAVEVQPMRLCYGPLRRGIIAVADDVKFAGRCDKAPLQGGLTMAASERAAAALLP